MELKNILSALDKETLRCLAQETTAEALRQQAEQYGHSITAEEAEVVFAALYPLRGVEPLDDSILEEVQGGYKATPTRFPPNLGLGKPRENIL